MTWWAVLALAAGTYVLKAAGPLALGSRTVPPPVQLALNLVSVTLLAALIAISTFGQGRSLVLDARAAGLAVAIVATWLRAPFAVVVIAATATAAGLRALAGRDEGLRAVEQVADADAGALPDAGIPRTLVPAWRRPPRWPPPDLRGRPGLPGRAARSPRRRRERLGGSEGTSPWTPTALPG